MTIREKLNFAEMKLDELMRDGSPKEREYWRGYITAYKEFLSLDLLMRAPGSELYRDIIISMVDNNMIITAVADELHYHNNTIKYHCDQINKKFGLDPRNLYDLCKLFKLVTGDDLL